MLRCHNKHPGVVSSVRERRERSSPAWEAPLRWIYLYRTWRQSIHLSGCLHISRCSFVLLRLLTCSYQSRAKQCYSFGSSNLKWNQWWPSPRTSIRYLCTLFDASYLIDKLWNTWVVMVRVSGLISQLQMSHFKDAEHFQVFVWLIRHVQRFSFLHVQQHKYTWNDWNRRF